MMPRAFTVRTALCGVAALIGFAANSLLARVALGPSLIDPVAFTAVRLGSGAITLVLLAWLMGRRHTGTRVAWLPPLALFAYAMAFSLAYVRLAVGMGALILFGAVQVTMIGWGLRSGERLGLATWLGLGCALAGLAALSLPGAGAPDLAAAALMIAAGVAWGAYSLQGRGSGDPLAGSAANFAWTLPLAAVALALAWPAVHASAGGIGYAVLSGSLASGLGYALWYAALPALAATAAAVAQLVVPVLAALGAVLLLGEGVSVRLLVAGTAILGGVALAFTSRPGRG
jgi:drug/metabolite transporter (DMT)-like permease